jgi:NADP-dependent 3-hydroxy acid dehydrogenase YdfG
MKSNSQIAIVTGASTGIGRATAIALAQAGYVVIATAREVSTLAALVKDLGIHALTLDVDSDESVQQAMRQVHLLTSGHGVDILVNNAGFAVPGPMESVPLERLRAGFDTNVIGLVRMCQAVLPQMRQRKSGCIVNVSSIVGRITFPFEGAYTATKHAVEALSDALRFEVQPFGVKVIVVQPGAIRSAFQHRGDQELITSLPSDSPYFKAMSGFLIQREKAFTQAPEGNAVAAAIVKALKKTGRPARIVVPQKARLFLTVFGTGPDRLRDAIKRKIFAPAN